MGGTIFDNTAAWIADAIDTLRAEIVALLLSYQLRTEKGAASGYASLDASVLVPVAQLATGSASASVWLRGDRAWAAPTAAEVGADPTGTAAAALAAHVAAGDPHTGYQLESERGAASGYASLDSGTKVPTAQLGANTPTALDSLRGSREWLPPSRGVATSTFRASGTGGGTQSSGMTSPTRRGGSVATANTASRFWVEDTRAASTGYVGWDLHGAVDRYVLPGGLAEFYCAFQLSGLLSSMRFVAGLADGGSVTGSWATNLIGLTLDYGADTKFQWRYSAGGAGPTAIDTGITPAIDTEYRIIIRCISSASVLLYLLDSSGAVLHSTQITSGAPTVALGWACQSNISSSAGTRNIRLNQVAIMVSV